MNTVSLVGRLARDPKLNITQSGKSVCNLTIAVNDVFSAEDRTDFLQVTVWGKQAENCDKYLQKGSRAGVEGRLHTDSYTDGEGIKRYPVTVVANRVEFLSELRVRDKENTVQQEGSGKPGQQGPQQDGYGASEAAGGEGPPDAEDMEPPEEGPEMEM
jgi:single-strand DNA-binding protein